MQGEVFAFKDWDLGVYDEEHGVFGVGNVVTGQGNIRYRLKTPYRDGTTHVIFEPLDFIARLAALVPKPPVNLTRFHIP